MNNIKFDQTFSLLEMHRATAAHPDPAFHDAADLIDAFRRHWIGLVVGVVGCLAAAGVYLVATPPEYVASDLMILEPSRSPADAAAAGEVPYLSSLDAAQADSQMQVVKSERLLGFVLDTLTLGDTANFAPRSPSLRQRIAGLFSTPVPATDQQRRDAALLSFMGKVAVRRIGISYVLEITFTASNPDVAAHTANSIASAYMWDQIASARRRREYLQGRITDLDEQENAALLAVRQGTVPSIRLTDSDARVISAAVVPTVKAFPQTGLVCSLAVLIGLVGGLGFILIRHSLDRRIRTRRQLPADVPCLSVLPSLCGLQQRQDLFRAIPPANELRGPYFDALRAALPGLLGAANAKKYRSIGITSWRGGEGRSSVARSLSRLIAAAGTDAVLVDADFRNPALSEALSRGVASGLSEVLRNGGTSGPITLVTLADRLRFVPRAGYGAPCDDNLYLGSAAAQRELERLCEIGTVVVDLAAMSVSSDAAAIGPLLDGIIVVVEANKTTLDDLAEALAALRAAECHVIGFVLNKGAALSERPRMRDGWLSGTHGDQRTPYRGALAWLARWRLATAAQSRSRR